MSIFFRSSMCFRVPHLCSNVPKIYHWPMDSSVHIVCFRGDFTIKTVVGFLRKNSFEKCVTRWSILFICNTFSCWLVLLLSFVYTELALVCCRNPDNVYCFGTIFPNIIFFFLHQSAPPVRSPCTPTNSEVAQLPDHALGEARGIPDGEQPKQRCGSEFAKWYDIYTLEECVDERKQNNADFKLLCHEWFHHVQYHVHDGHCTGEFAKVVVVAFIDTKRSRLTYESYSTYKHIYV